MITIFTDNRIRRKLYTAPIIKDFLSPFLIHRRDLLIRTTIRQVRRRTRTQRLIRTSPFNTRFSRNRHRQRLFFTTNNRITRRSIRRNKAITIRFTRPQHRKIPTNDLGTITRTKINLRGQHRFREPARTTRFFKLPLRNIFKMVMRIIRFTTPLNGSDSHRRTRRNQTRRFAVING